MPSAEHNDRQLGSAADRQRHLCGGGSAGKCEVRRALRCFAGRGVWAHQGGAAALEQGANLGGLDLSASYWFSRHWAAEGTGRAYLGTSGAGVNDLSINGPFVAEYVFAGGPEWLGPHNKHIALIAHALAGGAYGNFERDLRGNPPSSVEFFNDQLSLAALIGGHIELNRSARWVLRITPDAKYTRYSINYGNKDTYPYWNFALSAGVEYKFKKKR